MTESIRVGQQVVYRERGEVRGHVLTVTKFGPRFGAAALPIGELEFRLDTGAVTGRPGATITPPISRRGAT